MTAATRVEGPAEALAAPSVAATAAVTSRETLVARALAGLCVVVALAMLPWPMYWDHGIFVLVGQSIAHGHAPYVQAFDTKGPLAFLPFALTAWLPVRPEVALRLLDAVALLATGLVIDRALRPRVGMVPARLAAAFVVLGYVATGFVVAGQVDSWCGLVLTAGAVVALVLFPRRPLAAGLVYGVAVGLCTWVKPTFAAFGAVPLPALLLLAPELRRRGGRAFAGVVAGGVLVTVGVVAWFAAAGALGDLVEVQWTYNRTVYAVVGSKSLGGRLVALAHEFIYGSEFFLFPVLLPGVAVVLWDRRLPTAVRAFAVAFVGAAILNLVAQGKFLVYQWTPVAVPLWVMAGLGYARAVRDFRRVEAGGRAGLALAGTALAAALLSITLQPLREVARTAQLAIRGGEDAYLEGKTFASGFNGLAEVQAARFIAQHTRPGEPFGLWGLASNVAVLADRPVISRFVHSDPLRFGIGPLADRYRAEYLGAFDRARPRYYLYPGEPRDSTPTGTMRQQFPALMERLGRDYAYEGAVQGYVILRRKSAG